MRAERGLVFAHRYELIDLLAVGGMGEVWRAVDRVLGRDVAVKVLKPEHVADAGFLARFRGEARHAAILSHPGIATVYDYGEQDDSAYLVMELVDGEPLSTHLARVGPLTPDATADIVLQVADALAVAHRAGIVHRDVKPGNILVMPNGRVKLTDFGIAKALGSSSLTATGTVVGTAQYISPEQATGMPVSPASDVYALGVVTFEMLSGRPPFTGDNHVAIAMAHVRDAPPSLPPDVPRPFASLVRDSMAKDPTHRPVNAAAFAERLRAMRPPGAASSTPPHAATEPIAATMPRTQVAPAVATERVPAGGMGASAPIPAIATRIDLGDPGAANRAHRRWMAALVVVLFLVAAGGGALLARAALDRDGGGAAGAAATTAPSLAPVTTTATTTAPTAPSTSVARTTSTTQAATTVATTAAPVPVDEEKLLGKRAADVIATLKEAGLEVDVRYVKTEPKQRDRVVSVEPNGDVAAGATITVVVGSRSGDGPDGAGGD